MVVHGYNQQKGIDFIVTFSQLVHLEAIRILLTIDDFKIIKLFQMDVKSVFSMVFIEEEVCVKQSPGFKDPSKLDHIFKILLIKKILMFNNGSIGQSGLGLLIFFVKGKRVLISWLI